MTERGAAMVLGNGGGEAAAALVVAVAAPGPDADVDADAAAAAAARSLSAFCALILCSKTALSDGPGIQCFDGDKKGKGGERRRRQVSPFSCFMDPSLARSVPVPATADMLPISASASGSGTINRPSPTTILLSLNFLPSSFLFHVLWHLLYLVIMAT